MLTTANSEPFPENKETLKCPKSKTVNGLTLNYTIRDYGLQQSTNLLLGWADVVGRCLARFSDRWTFYAPLYPLYDCTGRDIL